jgi:hypothetical protein
MFCFVRLLGCGERADGRRYLGVSYTTFFSEPLVDLGDTAAFRQLFGFLFIAGGEEEGQ